MFHLEISRKGRQRTRKKFQARKEIDIKKFADLTNNPYLGKKIEGEYEIAVRFMFGLTASYIWF